MKAAAAASILLAIMALAAVMMAAPGRAQRTCAEVDATLAPCVKFLTGVDLTPPVACCEGVNKLRSMGANAVDRQFACNCVKQAAANFAGLKEENARNLPSLCSSPLPFPISMQLDCSKIPAN